MGAWFRRIWNDEEAFRTLARFLFKQTGALLSALLAAGIIVPPGSGPDTWKLGVVLLAIFGALPTAPIDPKARDGGPWPPRSP